MVRERVLRSRVVHLARYVHNPRGKVTRLPLASRFSAQTPTALKRVLFGLPWVKAFGPSKTNEKP